MLTDIERVWQRLKDVSQEVACLPSNPSEEQSRILVIDAIQEENADVPPDEVVDYFAHELVSLVNEERKRL